MSPSAACCFDTLATNPRWQTFTAEEHRKVGAFVRRWRIKPGDRVLEPGCGSGRLTAVLAALTGPTGRVLAFDAAPACIRLAAQRCLPPHVTLRTARAETLALAPESFDHVICFNVFPHLVPQVGIARCLAAALRTGGVFWIAHTGSRAFVNAVHRRGPPALHDHLLPTPRRLARLLHEAGLKEVAIDDRADRFLARAVRRVS
ncbi:MAG: class I SAM-dependent methyltransferase [Opitutaceae bacterium]|nr:class I SAM-dependent methyltransferase [Opitutaceae bacterium]